jgi:hypothetical protein
LADGETRETIFFENPKALLFCHQKISEGFASFDTRRQFHIAILRLLLLLPWQSNLVVRARGILLAGVLLHHQKIVQSKRIITCLHPPTNEHRMLKINLPHIVKMILIPKATSSRMKILGHIRERDYKLCNFPWEDLVRLQLS